MLSRRRFTALSVQALPPLVNAGTKGIQRLPKAFAALERSNGGRLGVAVMEMTHGNWVGHRAEERFPMCSTFKFLLAAAVLRRVDQGQEALENLVAIPRAPLLPHSPLTEPHAGGRMTVAALCRAALTQSDNTAANLLLERIGGPARLTSFARSIGDEVTRLDRWEPALNECLTGDPRDTTSPTAMVSDLRTLLLAGGLSRASREQQTAWMQANVTGLDRLRANLPTGWRAADKTGSNGEHTSNDIAVFWPPNDRPPILVAAYITQCPGAESKRAGMLAEIGKLVREAAV